MQRQRMRGKGVEVLTVLMCVHKNKVKAERYTASCLEKIFAGFVLLKWRMSIYLPVIYTFNKFTHILQICFVANDNSTVLIVENSTNLYSLLV